MDVPSPPTKGVYISFSNEKGNMLKNFPKIIIPIFKEFYD